MFKSDVQAIANKFAHQAAPLQPTNVQCSSSMFKFILEQSQQHTNVQCSSSMFKFILEQSDNNSMFKRKCCVTEEREHFA